MSMNKSAFALLKQRLPPRLSFRLRCLKARMVDAEMRLLESLAKSVGGSDAVALDVGANSGIYSQMLSRHFGTVLSVEPYPECVRYMGAVLPGNCTIVEAAASSQMGSATLRVPISSGAVNSTRATISSDNQFVDLELAGTQEIVVDTRSLDGIISSEIGRDKRVGLIKVDVEGHEFEALSGAKDVIGRWRPALYVEVEDRHGAKTSDLFVLFDELGYQVVRLSDGRYVADASFADPASRTIALKSAPSVNLVLLPRT